MWNDLRFALRLWRRVPGTAAIIILAVALGIAAVSTIFSWAQGLILRPLPAVQDPARLVSLTPQGPGGRYNVAWDEFRDWRDQSVSYQGTAAFGIRRVGLREAGASPDRATEPLWGMLVSGDYFTVLGVTPRLGRLIGPEDARVAGTGAVAVISEALWHRRFGGMPDVIGRRIVLNGSEVTIVGVAARRFAGTYVGLSFDVWIPVTMEEALGGSSAALRDREFRWLQAFGRLGPGVRLEQAGDEAARIGRRLAGTFPASRDIALVVRPLDVGAASRLTPLFSVLLGLAIVVLVVVCATVSNLLLAQATTREAEMAVRLATGARPSRLVRQLLTESALLAGVAGGLGVLISLKARGLFPALLPPSPLPITIDTPVDARVVAFAVTLTTLTLLVFGLAPALGAVQKARTAGLRVGLHADRGRVRWRRGLVAAQIAFSLMALVSSAMFARRLLELRDVDRGFVEPERVLIVTTDLDLAGITEPAERRAVLDRLQAELRGWPGVRGVALASFVPLGFSGYREVDVDAAGYVSRTGEPARTLVSEVGPGYFDLMGIPVLDGRAIAAGDDAEGRPVVVVNEALVNRFGLAPALGRRIRLGEREVVVVGVARDGKYRFDELEDPARPVAYVPWTQWGASTVTLHIRTRGDPMGLVPTLGRTFAMVDSRLPALTPMTLDAYTSLPLFPGRLATTVLGVLAVGALVLSALGLYGVTRFSVAARTRELGIRMALGAGPRQLLGLVIGDSARFASIGLVVGVVLAFGATRILVAALPNLRPEPLAMAAAGVLLALIFGAAVSLAARRSTRIDPAAALRDAR